MDSRILSLGTRRDATTWEKGCRSIGLNVPTPIKLPKPSLKSLKTFFGNSPEWIFFAGHFSDYTLYNEDDSVSVRFNRDSVEVEAEGNTILLKKSKKEFRLSEKCLVVLWGGCSVCRYRDTIETLRALFGEHVLLGFAGLTGWRIVDAMLGGGFMRRHFFSQVQGHENDPVKIRKGWMSTAKRGYGGGKNEGRFRAIDPDGQEWLLRNGLVTRGRKFA